MNLGVPGAIVLGAAIVGVCVGAGVYFGLRARAPDAARAAAEARVAPLVPPAASNVVRLGAAPVRLPPSASSGAATPDVDALATARAAIAARHDAWRERCFAPALARAAAPARSRHVVHSAFDAGGLERIRAIEGVTDASRDDVADCLRALPIDLRIAPPGRQIDVRVEISFP